MKNCLKVILRAKEIEPYGVLHVYLGDIPIDNICGATVPNMRENLKKMLKTL